MKNLLIILACIMPTIANANDIGLGIPEETGYVCQLTHVTMKTNGFVTLDKDKQFTGLVTSDKLISCPIDTDSCWIGSFTGFTDKGSAQYTDENGDVAITNLLALELGAGYTIKIGSMINIVISGGGGCNAVDRTKLDNAILKSVK